MHPILTGASGTSLAESFLLPVVAPHSEDLHHPDEDIDEVQLQTNTLIHRIPLDQAPFRHSRMVQDFLDIVQRFSPKDPQASPQKNVLTPQERACCRGRENEGGETGDGDKHDTRENRSAEVEVFILLGGSADESD